MTFFVGTILGLSHFRLSLMVMVVEIGQPKTEEHHVNGYQESGKETGKASLMNM